MSDDKPLTPGEELLAEALAEALTPRHDRVDALRFGLAPAEARVAVRGAHEALAALARAEMPVAPRPEVRARLVDTLEKHAARRALLVIDMIMDHLEPGVQLEVPRAREIVPALKARIAEARAAGVPVVYVVDEHDVDDPDLDAWGTHAVKGTRGTEVWPDLAPAAGDRIVKKPTYSAFHDSTLAKLLDELKVDTLVLTGCLTEVGIMATATDALQRGFAVEVPQDSQAGTSPEVEAVALGTLAMLPPFGPARKARLELARAA